nr:GNAT family N-acetyltransferase [Vector pEGY_EC_13655]
MTLSCSSTDFENDSDFRPSRARCCLRHPRAWRSAKRNHLLGNPREISQSRRQRPRVRSCLAFTFRPPASGPWSGSAKVGADMLGSSGSNCTMRRRFIPRQGSEWTARSLRTFGSPARVISTRLCG